ncbi:MAG TPA: PAS domain S-box protein [Trueperaceae bacterium]|nr:PAS domain S-box protein [Trueperaceae bacterium]
MSTRAHRGGDPLSFLLELAHRMEMSQELEPALATLVEGLARLQGWDAAEAWVLESDGKTIVPGAVWVRDDELGAFVREDSPHAYLPDGGLVRDVWRTRTTAWHEDLLSLPERDFLRHGSAERHGIRSAALVPVVASERTLAVLALFSRDPRPEDPDAMRLARAAATEVAWLLERRIHARRVREADARFELVSGNARDIVSMHAPDGAYLWASPSALEILGYRPEELVGRMPPDLMHPEDRERAIGNLRELLAGNDRRLPRYRYRRKDGSYVWLESAARAVRDETTGEVTRLVASSRDVDESVRDRRALEESQRRFRRLFADNPLPMWVFDTETLAILEVNEAAVAAYGYERAAFLGMSVLDIRPAEDRPALRKMVSSERPALTRASGWRHVRADGTVLDVEIDSHATVFNGRAARLIVARDVSRRRQLERERERRSVQLAALADAAVRIHGAADLDSVLQRLADAARDVIGAHQAIASLPDGPTGMHTRYRVSLSERYAGYRDYDGHPDGTGIYRLVVERRHPLRMTQAELEAHPAYRAFGAEAGSHPPLRGWLAAPLLGTGGEALGVVQVSDRDEGDFTADDEAMLVQLAQLASVALEKTTLLGAVQEQARDLERRVGARTAELQALNRELEGFSYSVSHDLRTPLRAIDGFGSALLEDYADRLDAEGRHYLERMRGAAQHMGTLIDDLLTLSRVGRTSLEPRDLDLAELAREVAAELREAEPDREVALTVQEGLPARGDRTLLRLVLQNLIGNAWKFTSHTAGARIDVRAEQVEGAMTYTVSDNGAGFDMRYVEQLFRPFQRLHAAADFPGSGVGLANVQRIVQRHGGRVWAEGEVDVGAAFHFTLGEGTR